MDFAKKTTKSKRSKRAKISKLYLRWGVLTVAGLLVISGMSFFIYKSFASNTGVVASAVINARSWVADRKSNFQQGVTKVKQIAVKKVPAEPQIHFDFYTTLADAKVPIPIFAQETPSVHESYAPKKETPKPSIAANTFLTTAEELEKELSEQIKQTKSQKRDHS